MKSMAIMLLLLSLNLQAAVKSICGPSDDRTRSYDKKVARVRRKLDGTNACTATLIGKSCMVSAGHCTYYLGYAEFETPDSNDDGTMAPSSEDNIYEIDRSSIKTTYHVSRGDWSVFKTFPHKKTGKFAGEVYGSYQVGTGSEYRDAREIRITGNGVSGINYLNRAQKTHYGEVVKIDDKRIRYKTDTSSGNSGSAIIDHERNIIIGVHTNGGCQERYGSNFGYLISKDDDFKNAISDCLKEER